MEWVALLVLLVALLLFGGAICGIIAVARLSGVARRVEQLDREVSNLKYWSKTARYGAPVPERAPAQAAPPEVPPIPRPPGPEGIEVHDRRPAAPTEPPVVPRPARVPVPAPAARRPALQWPASAPSLEMMLGTKGIVWVGMVMLLVGSALFMKYAYDNNWIGPQGRLAIGAFAGIVSLALGERFRRRDWQALFQTLTGGGIAAFYICIFFSFQVYHLSGAPVSMALAVLVTGLAVVLAVAHNTVAIAILALIGGFLSPVLLSTGENHPYALFTYIAILNLVALGAAYFRRWRALDLLCFLGTSLLYQAWYMKFYRLDQLTPALLYISLFYVMFLLIPMLYALVRRVPGGYEGLVLLALNACFSFYCYYTVLFHHYRQTLGFVVVAQALLVAILFRAWVVRLGKESATGPALLIISLALVTIAVPIQLKLYGIALAWAMEGIVFVYLGIRFQQVLCRLGGLVALFLAAGALVHRLPLHALQFTPVFNVAFGSWLCVIVAALIVAWLLYRNAHPIDDYERYMVVGPLLLAFAGACGLLSLETAAYWRFSGFVYWQTHQIDSLIVLWALIGLITATVVNRLDQEAWIPLAWIVYGVGACMCLAGLTHYRLPDATLAINTTFIAKLAFIASLWWGSRLVRLGAGTKAAPVLELVGHALLTALVAIELQRWGHTDTTITPRMAVSLISAAWALQAFGLIWLGLGTRDQIRRIAGFVLFGLVVGKVLLIDTSQLERVYRIVSWLASGLLLLMAGYFYQRYSALLLREQSKEDHP